MCWSYLPIVKVCLARQAMLSGSEMKVPNALALATGHALAAVDPAPGKTKIRGGTRKTMENLEKHMSNGCQIDWCGSSLHLVPHNYHISLSYLSYHHLPMPEGSSRSVRSYPRQNAAITCATCATCARCATFTCSAPGAPPFSHLRLPKCSPHMEGVKSTSTQHDSGSLVQ